LLVAAGLGIILLAKPLLALLIVAIFGYSARTALTVALGMGQIGEFSFILSQVAREHHLMPDEGHHLLVATAIISITLNPLLFNSMERMERWLKSRPTLWRLLNARGNRRMNRINEQAQNSIAANEKPLAVIVGYGPVGHVVDALLRDSGLETVIIDTNMETVQSLTRQNRQAIFGDATHMDILSQAGVKKAMYLVVTLPHSANRGPLLLAARELNPKLEIIVRARYMGERMELQQYGTVSAVYEEGEAGIALARQVMKRRGVDEDTMDRLLGSLRRLWSLGD
jgi:CPA2 family monovalent cation:H+ antiporter-2